MMHQQQTNIHSEGSQLSKLFGAHLPKHSGQEQFTSDPSNLLMQVLGVQRDGQVNSCQESSQKSLVVGNKPANALTLDEVLAKENISVSGDDQGDQSAFKKFLATIQQQQSPGDLPSSNSVMVSACNIESILIVSCTYITCPKQIVFVLSRLLYVIVVSPNLKNLF